MADNPRGSNYHIDLLSCLYISVEMLQNCVKHTKHYCKNKNQGISFCLLYKLFFRIFLDNEKKPKAEALSKIMI